MIKVLKTSRFAIVWKLPLLLKRCTPQKNVYEIDHELGRREMSPCACPGEGNSQPGEKKIANPWGYTQEGGGCMVTGQIEACIILICNSSFETTF